VNQTRIEIPKARPLCFAKADIKAEIPRKMKASKFESRTKTKYLNTPSEPTLNKMMNPLIPKPKPR